MALFIGSVSVHADDMDRIRQLRSSDQVLPLSTILIRLEQQYPGTLLNVELEDESDSIVYEIEILGADHIIRQIKVDARNGHIIKSEHD
jgi:uncharacterized membrane protein YkoI